MESHIKKNIQHVIVLMLENRSFDNLLGWLYETKQPKHFLPANTPESLKRFNGLPGTSYSNPLDLNNPATAITASKGVDNYCVPNPDPHEYFKYMNRQLIGLEIDKSTEGWLPKPAGIPPNMQGFLADYATVKCASRKIAPQIMQTYSPDSVAVMSGLAENYAVSDIKNLLGYCADGYALSSLQKSIIVANEHYRLAKASGFTEKVHAGQVNVDKLLSNIKTESDMLAYFQANMREE